MAEGWKTARGWSGSAGGKSRRRTRIGPNAPRAFADPPSLHFFVRKGMEDRARMVRLGRRQKSRRRTRIGPNAPRAFADPPSLHFIFREGNGTGPRAAKRIHTYTRKRDGSSGRKAASAQPRCLRHPKTRPVQSASGTRRPVPLLPPRPQAAAPAADRPAIKP